MRKLVSVLAVTVLVACSDRPATDVEAIPPFDPAELDPLTRPQDDFFAWVNGRWITATEIPAEWSRYGTLTMIQEKTEAQLRSLLEAEADADDSDEAKSVRALYRSFMDESQADQLGTSPLLGELERIDALENHDDLSAYLGYALRAGIQVPVNFYVDGDADDPETNLLYLWQDGLGLPERDYYLADNPELAKIRDAYQGHVGNMAELAGWEDADGLPETIMAMEQRLAEAHWTSVQNRDRERIYRNQVARIDLAEAAPGLDWDALLESAGFGNPEKVVVAQDSYFEELGEILREFSMDQWREYLRFKALKAYAPYLSQPVVAEDFEFEGRTLRGQQEQKARWKRGIRLVNGALGEALGKAYVAEYFPPESRDRMLQLVENLILAFDDSISDLDWMSPETREHALTKLASFRTKIGYPDKWRDYAGLEIDENDLFGNVRRSLEFEHLYHAGKLSRPVDRDEWGMTPQTVNAYYRPTFNEIVFPAAILQPPVFDMSADDALNYGAIGAVIGHEISHGFDDQGRKFDGLGRLHNWWTDEDAKEYELRAAGLVDQFNRFEPLPGEPINGELTLGENIGDLAGLIMAHRAYRLALNGEEPPVVDGLDGDQRFFVGFARAWRSKTRAEYLREMLLRDPHSPPEYRVNGILPNVPAFYEAFGLKEGDGMFLPPEERVAIW